MKAIKYSIPELAKDGQMNCNKGLDFLLHELCVQRATFFVIGKSLYVVDDKSNKGLQSLFEFINVDPKDVESTGVVELECDIQQKVKLL